MHNAYQLRSQTTSIHHSLERQAAAPPHLSKDAFVSLIPPALPANHMNEPHLTHSEQSCGYVKKIKRIIGRHNYTSFPKKQEAESLSDTRGAALKFRGLKKE